MKVIVVENYEEMSAKAAEILTNIVKSNPKAVLGLATGSSPIGTYQNMVKDETEKALHLEKYEGQVCVEWEFIQIVQGNKNLTEKQKKEVISMGLKALSGVRL